MSAKKIAIALLVLGSLLVPASQAQAAAPAWKLTASALPTNFVPGSEGTAFGGPLYYLIATNVGGEAANGPITLTATLPTGVSAVDVGGVSSKSEDSSFPKPACTVSGQIVTCTATGSLPPGYWVGAEFVVNIAPNASGPLIAPATVSGGGAPPASATAIGEASSSPAPFGFLPGAASLLSNDDGSPAIKAGSRPSQLTIDFGFPVIDPNGSFLTNTGHPRELRTDLPRGLVVNPHATPVLCTEAELETENNPGCPAASQLGVVTVLTDTLGTIPILAGLYNMVPPPGTPAELGFNGAGVGAFIHIDGGVRSDGDYGLSATTSDIIGLPKNPVLGVQAQLWGDPSAKSHDQIRSTCGDSPDLRSCSVPPKSTPLLSMPSACSQSPLITHLEVDSWEQPGVFDQADLESRDLAGNPVGVNSCSLLEFEPKLTLRPEVSTAETPSGPHIDLHVPQQEGKNELATANLKDATVTLPAGMVLNPSAAGGLSACDSAQIGLLGTNFAPPHRIRFSATPAQCPDSSKVGRVEVHTPLLDHPLPGAVYTAKPYDNPFNSLLGIYIAIDDPQSGVVAKLAGKVSADPLSGQLTTTFAEGPELPFEDFVVDLFAGPRAALRTPSDCGDFATRSQFTSWAGPATVPSSDPFAIGQGAKGAACTFSEAQRPHSPSFQAGTQIPLAGTYSPFLGRLQREDGTQQLQGLDLTLPAGLTGKLAGIPSCSDAALAAAASKTGSAELASPSCPAASQVGEVRVGAGAGSAPYYATGKAYIAGPYKGAPLSFAIITPAVAGPFDLGTVVVRAAAYLNPITSIITVKSDPFPRILEGIPLDVRDIQVNMSRPSFTLNPTSCDPKVIRAEAISLLGQIAPLSDRFQVGGCRGLDFAPTLSLRLKGGTKRGAHPGLRAVGTAKPGEANLARASVALPHSEFLDQAHIRTVCTRVQFAASQCPAGSVYGKISATTPLLDEQLSGPVYLRSSSHKLPDLVAVLRGPASRPVEINVIGRIDSINGGIRTTIESVPDAPVSKFTLQMQGGRKGLLINSRNLCTSTNRATVLLEAQNGKVHDFNPALKADCAKGSKKHRRARG